MTQSSINFHHIYLLRVHLKDNRSDLNTCSNSNSSSKTTNNKVKTKLLKIIGTMLITQWTCLQV